MKALLALSVGVGLLLFCAGSAWGHGLVERGNLPIPAWLFTWMAAIVLVVSFFALAALWDKPKLENDRWRPLLSTNFGRIFEVIAGTFGTLFLVITVTAGFIGPQNSSENFAPTFVFIVFWVALAFASAIFGDVYRALNPWRAIGRLVGAAQRNLLPGKRSRSGGRVERGGGAAATRRLYPAWLGYWPAIIGLLAFTWIELVSGWAEHPSNLAIAILVYSAITFTGQAIYGTETWHTRADCFSVYFNLLGRLSPFKLRNRQLGLQPPASALPALVPTTPPHKQKNGQTSQRRAGKRFAGLQDLTPLQGGLVTFVCAMIGTVTFDGLTQGSFWNSIGTALSGPLEAIGVAGETGEKVKETIGLLACVLIVGLFYRLGVAGMTSITTHHTTKELQAKFIHTLVPIALAYVAAHYFTFLILEGQAFIHLISDPFGTGANIFNTANFKPNLGLINQPQAWWFQVSFVLIGHITALIFAHDRAIALFPDPKEGTRSQIPMLIIMVGFTSLALWLLSQVGTAG